MRRVGVHWAQPGSRFTALFEALIIDWLKEASISANQFPGPPIHMGIDERLFQKRHEYVTVIIDQDQGTHVADGRSRGVLDSYLEPFMEFEKVALEATAINMWKPPYIAASLTAIPDAPSEVCFDKIHVAQHLGGRSTRRPVDPRTRSCKRAVVKILRGRG